MSKPPDFGFFGGSAPTRQIAAQPLRPYTTQITPDEEAQFQAWVKRNNIPWRDEAKADYDMRGFWRAMTAGDPNASRSAANQHFPDTWKTPYHKSFSNESIYAPPDAPHWDGNRLIDKNGAVVFEEK